MALTPQLHPPLAGTPEALALPQVSGFRGSAAPGLEPSFLWSWGEGQGGHGELSHTAHKIRGVKAPVDTCISPLLPPDCTEHLGTPQPTWKLS